MSIMINSPLHTASLIIIISVWALAAVAAHQAYNNPAMLDLAISAWGIANQFMIRPSDAAAGTQATRDVPFSSTCNNGG